jgi:hypothetical protein
VIVVAATEHGVYEVDTETEEVEPSLEAAPEPGAHRVGLPREVDAATAGATMLVAVAARPPLLVSYDAGATWRESGRGLPPLFAVAIADDDPDSMAAASRNRLHVSHDGGRFWTTLAAELPAIRAIAVTA